MSTTLLFVELLIIGLQTAIWSLVLVFIIFGFDWVLQIHLLNLTDFDAIFTIIFLSLIYILGILFDRFSDSVFANWDKQIANKVFTEKHSPPFLIRFRIAKENEYLDRQFEYTRSRLRIARASALNFSITTLLCIVLIYTRFNNVNDKDFYIGITGILGTTLTGWALFAWYKLLNGFYDLIKMAIHPDKSRHTKQLRIRKKKKVL